MARRAQAMYQLGGLLVSAPGMLREQFAGLDRAALIRTLARLGPGARTCPVRRPPPGRHCGAGPSRHQAMDTEITGLDTEICPQVMQAAPALLELPGVGPETPAA